MIPDGAVARFALLACQARSDEARSYLCTMLPRATPCEQIRKFLVGYGLSAEAMALIDDALPWLACGTLGESSVPDSRDIMATLADAGAAGLARSELADAEFEAVRGKVVEFTQPTGGRPRKMVRLKVHDTRHNPFAPQC